MRADDFASAVTSAVTALKRASGLMAQYGFQGGPNVVSIDQWTNNIEPNLPQMIASAKQWDAAANLPPVTPPVVTPPVTGERRLTIALPPPSTRYFSSDFSPKGIVKQDEFLTATFVASLDKYVIGITHSGGPNGSSRQRTFSLTDAAGKVIWHDAANVMSLRLANLWLVAGQTYTLTVRTDHVPGLEPADFFVSVTRQA